ncbi:MAG: peptidoglycan-binding protein [Pirellulaceae bacterium]
MTVELLVRCVDGTCKSQLFSDDGELSISAGVGLGGFNQPEDVRTIQEALNRVPESQGGPAVALVVDGIAGQRTQAAIAKFQRHHFGWADGLIERNKRTHQRLREVLGIAPSDSSDGGVAPPQAGSPGGGSGAGGSVVTPKPHVMARFLSQISEARRWIHSAMRALDLAKEFIRDRRAGPLTEFQMMGAKETGLVYKYFSLDKLSTPMQLLNIEQIREVFGKMETCVGRASPITWDSPAYYFQEDPTNKNKSGGPHLAFTYYGGFTRQKKWGSGAPMSRDDNYAGPNLRQDTIFISTHTLERYNTETYTGVLLHELAHFCGPEVNSANRIGDHGQLGDAGFFKLSPFQAVRNADTYSSFAGEVKLGRELRWEKDMLASRI